MIWAVLAALVLLFIVLCIIGTRKDWPFPSVVLDFLSYWWADDLLW